MAFGLRHNVPLISLFDNMCRGCQHSRSPATSSAECAPSLWAIYLLRVTFLDFHRNCCRVLLGRVSCVLLCVCVCVCVCGCCLRATLPYTHQCSYKKVVMPYWKKVLLNKQGVTPSHYGIVIQKPAVFVTIFAPVIFFLKCSSGVSFSKFSWLLRPIQQNSHK